MGSSHSYCTLIFDLMRNLYIYNACIYYIHSITLLLPSLEIAVDEALLLIMKHRLYVMCDLNVSFTSFLSSIELVVDEALATIMKHRLYVLIPIMLVNNGLVIVVLLRGKGWKGRSSIVYLLQIAVWDSMGILLDNTLVLLIPSYCKMVQFVLTITNIYPVWLLVSLVAERAIVMLFPFTNKRFISRKNAVFMSLGVFLLVSLPTSMMVFFFENCDGGVNANVYLVTYPIVYSFIPSVLFLIFNGIIIGKVVHSRSLVQCHNNRDTYHVTYMAVMLSLTFMIMTAPLSVLLILQSKESKFTYEDTNVTRTKYVMSTVGHLLSESYHICTIFVYIISSKRFRNDFLRFIRCKCSQQ